MGFEFKLDFQSYPLSLCALGLWTDAKVFTGLRAKDNRVRFLMRLYLIQWLSTEMILPPGDVWQCLETFFGGHNLGGATGV